MKKKGLIFSLVAVMLLVAVGCFGQGIGDKGTDGENAAKQEEKKVLAKNQTAVFETSKGNFKVELFEDKVPLTTKNFITLAQKGFYDNLIFHRVIDGFMIQGGDPNGNGSGGPGYTIKDEFHRSLKHNDAGILSMANAGPNTGGSQFFITLDKTPWLDGKHAVFGKVTEGLDVVKAIGKVTTDFSDRPVNPVVIKKITIVSE